MRISEFCVNYFSGFHLLSNYKNNNSKINSLAILKILSYFTVVMPLGFAIVYAASLCGRVIKKNIFSSLDKKVQDVATQTSLDITPFLAKAENYAEEHGNSFLGDPRGARLLDCITERLQSSEFQNDPELYMLIWKEKRGTTEEYRYPSDSARRFFERQGIPLYREMMKPHGDRNFI